MKMKTECLQAIDNYMVLGEKNLLETIYANAEIENTDFDNMTPLSKLDVAITGLIQHGENTRRVMPIKAARELIERFV